MYERVISRRTIKGTDDQPREREREDLREPAPRPNCVLSSRPSGLVKIKVTRACAGLLFAPSLFFVYQMQMRARA